MQAMFAMDLRHVINATVRGIHAGKNSEQAAGVGTEPYLRIGKPTKALHMAFDLRGHYYWHKRKGGKLYEVNCARGVHLLFHRPYGSTGFCSTYTFIGVCESPFDRMEEVKKWEYLSSHDSCWIDAAASSLANLYFEMANELVVAGKFSTRKAPAPKDMSWNVWFRDFQTTELYEWVDVQIDHVPTEPGYGRDYKLTLL